MKHEAHAPVAKPMDRLPDDGVQAPTLDSAERAYRAWLDGAQAMQAEATEFVNARAGKDMAALSEWTRCATPTDALEMQARYASEALADYVAGSQRMWQLMAAAGQPVPTPGSSCAGGCACARPQSDRELTMDMRAKVGVDGGRVVTLRPGKAKRARKSRRA